MVYFSLLYFLKFYFYNDKKVIFIVLILGAALVRHSNSLRLAVWTGLTFSLTFRLNNYVKEHLSKCIT